MCPKLDIFKEMVRANRRQLELDKLYSPERCYFSPLYYAQYQITLPLIKKYVRGCLIDLGCGDMPFREEMEQYVVRYDSLDFFPRNDEVTYISNIQNMDIIPDKSYDSAICLEVLEHIADPFQAVCEIYRILAPQGIGVISVPHLSRLHEEPHDYYRYTKYGLKYMFERAGFRIIELRHRGGIFSFLGHQLSTIILGVSWGTPILRNLFWFANSWLVVRICFYLDRLMDQSGILPAGYTIVVKKLESKEYMA